MHICFLCTTFPICVNRTHFSGTCVVFGAFQHVIGALYVESGPNSEQSGAFYSILVHFVYTAIPAVAIIKWSGAFYPHPHSDLH